MSMMEGKKERKSVQTPQCILSCSSSTLSLSLSSVNHDLVSRCVTWVNGKGRKPERKEREDMTGVTDTAIPIIVYIVF